MRFLIVNTDYPEFLADLYSRNPGLAEASYAEQIQARYDSLFSMADFYSRNLRALGHEAWEIYLNNEPLQRAWANEHSLRLRRPVARQLVWRRGVVPWIRSVADHTWYAAVFLAQVEHYHPDVVINHNLFTIGDDLIAAIRPRVAVIAAQHAATRPPGSRDWQLYDVFLSSFPPTVDHFARLGRRSEFLPLGFEPRVLDALGAESRQIPLTFVGSFHGVHSARMRLLETVAQHCGLSVWTGTHGADVSSSRLSSSIRGTAWGRDMYRVLARSMITLNHHGDVGPYANNLRLFEATGVGALLITDYKPNLSDYFDVGREVVAYRDEDECVELIRHYLDHPDERAAIASAGQTRTIRCHTWADRMKKLVAIVERCT